MRDFDLCAEVAQRAGKNFAGDWAPIQEAVVSELGITFANDEEREETFKLQPWVYLQVLAREIYREARELGKLDTPTRKLVHSYVERHGINPNCYDERGTQAIVNAIGSIRRQHPKIEDLPAQQAQMIEGGQRRWLKKSGGL
jgi:hypothetical protein